MARQPVALAAHQALVTTVQLMTVRTEGMEMVAAVISDQTSNPALNPVRFALWTLRDKAAQRRLALR